MPENRKKSRNRRRRGSEGGAGAGVPARGPRPGERPSAPSATAGGGRPSADENGFLEGDAPRTVDSAEADIAEAQMALHRDEPGEVPDEDELEAFEEADAEAHANGGGGRSGALAERPARAHPAERVNGVTRLADFCRGSWRELQRVQWPDRRQVFQATGVVLGFVIVAGVFLGVADLVAEHVVKFILK